MTWLRRWRWLNRVYANAVGYFWLPCPLCGEMFGGHETGTVVIYDTPFSGHGRMTCFRHTKATHG
jgi:hypothetical protein